MRREQIIRDVGTYTLGSQFTQFISLIAGVLTRNFLGPLQMGVWATLQIVLDYSKYTTLGTTEAVPREIPYYLGKGDQAAADEVKNVVATFSMAAAIVTGFGIILYAVIFRAQLSEPFFWGLMFVAVLLVLQRLNNHMISLLRAYKEFHLATQQMILSAVANAVFIAFFAYRFKIYGFMCAMVFSFLFNIFFISWHYDFQFRFQLNRSLWKLMAFGMPLMVLQLVNILLRSVDKILIAKFLGFEAMGFYSVATMGSNYLSQIPNSIGTVMIPNFHERYGARDRIEDVRAYVDKALSAFVKLMPLFIGISWILIPLFIKLFMPQYASGIRAAQFLMPGIFFIGLSQTYGNFIVVIKKHLWIFPITGLTALVTAMADYLIIRAGYGITGVAAMTSLGLAVNFLFLLVLSSKWLYQRAHIFSILGEVFARFFSMVVILMLLDLIALEWDVWRAASLRMVIYVLACLPALCLLEKEFAFFDLFFKKRITRGKYL